MEDLKDQQAFGSGADRFLVGLKSMFSRLAAWWEVNGDTVMGFLEWAAVTYPRAQLLEATGWLPHYTTPVLDPEQGVEAADALIAQHYDQAWPEVEATFRDRLASWRVDEEAKACFGEALAAHRHGLYRVAPRLLFPEIERLARSHLGDHLTVSSSQRDLRFAAGELGAENFMRTGILTLRLFGAFADRIYANAKTEEQLAAVRADPVPNRHAAIHGLAIYNTQKSSLNALFIAEFVLLTIDAVKAEALGQAKVLPPGLDHASSLLAEPRPKIAGAPEIGSPAS
jgi:hypothetical protein